MEPQLGPQTVGLRPKLVVLLEKTHHLSGGDAQPFGRITHAASASQDDVENVLNDEEVVLMPRTDSQPGVLLEYLSEEGRGVRVLAEGVPLGKSQGFAQTFESPSPILMLRPALDCRNDQSGGLMPDPNGRRGFVAFLPAGSAGPEGVDLALDQQLRIGE